MTTRAHIFVFLIAFGASLGSVTAPDVQAASNRMAGSVPVSAATLAARAEREAARAAEEEKTQQNAPAKNAQKLESGRKSQPEAAIEPAAAADADEPMPEAPRIAKTKGPVNYVGQIETYKARGDETLLTIGEREHLGYVELRSANPSMDPWHPGAGTYVILPKMHLLPDAPRKGIVVNLSEMRLYYYKPDGSIKTFPIGVGREGFSTPVGTTTVVRKAVGPTWRPTERMRREDPSLKAVYQAGPDNPLGTHALYLGWPQYMLHGTNKPWGIGRRVSSGCIRMYNDTAEEMFASVPVGTVVTTVRQPVKFGWINDMLYVEAHPDGALADQVERVGGAPLDYKVPPDIFANLSRAAGEARDRIDWKVVRDALRDRRGYPVPILIGAGEDDIFVTRAMQERAGTSRFGPRLTAEQPPVPTPVPAGGVSNVQQGQVAPNAADSAPRRRSSGFNG